MRKYIALVACAFFLHAPAYAETFDCGSTKPALSQTGKAQAVDADWWRAKHQGDLELAKLQHPKIVFMGDSQTEWWPGEIWQKTFAPLGALNFGLHNDKIENLLWRFEHANSDIWNAQTFVILIGTNNISTGDTALNVADGIRILLHAIRNHAQANKIILLGLLPREKGTNDWVLKTKNEVNNYIGSCIGLAGVTYVDLSDLLVDSKGDLNDGIGPDQLHLTKAGYGRINARIAEALKK